MAGPGAEVWAPRSRRSARRTASEGGNNDHIQAGDWSPIQYLEDLVSNAVVSAW